MIYECWEFTGCRNKKGYGICHGPTHGAHLTHRAVWQAYYGPIPADLQIDHTCENTSCYNPLHLDLVDNDENMRRRSERRTLCNHGHQWVVGSRRCATCTRDQGRENMRRYRDSRS